MATRRKLGAVLVLASCFIGMASLPARANDDKTKPGLTGSWAKKDGELKIAFVDKESMKLFPHGDQVPFAILCSYSLGKDGIVKAKITDFEAKEELKQKAKASLPIGLEFTFKWLAKKDVATVEDVKGENADPLKAHLEGDYEQKK